MGGGGVGGWLRKHLLRRDNLYHLRFQPNRNSKLQAFLGPEWNGRRWPTYDSAYMNVSWNGRRMIPHTY